MINPLRWFRNYQESVRQRDYQIGYAYGRRFFEDCRTPLERETKIAMSALGDEPFDRGVLDYGKMLDSRDVNRVYTFEQIQWVINDLRRGPATLRDSAYLEALSELEDALLSIPVRL